MLSRILWCLLLLGVFAGCTTPIPTVTPPSAPASGAPTGQAEIFFIWLRDGPSVQKVALAIDGRKRAEMRSGSFARVKVDGGEHLVKASFAGFLGVGMPSAQLRVSLEGGRRYYLMFGHEPGTQVFIPAGATIMPMTVDPAESDLVFVPEGQAKGFLPFVVGVPTLP